MSSVGPMGSNGWRHGGNGRGDMAEGRRIPSWVHLNRSCVSPPGPRWSSTTGERDVRAAEEGGRKGGESVEGENEQALILCPGDLWS